MKRREFTGALFATAVGAIAVNSQSKQTAQLPIRERRRVIPIQVIERFHLQPVTGTLVPYVLGENGMPYGLDDLLAAMCETIWR